MNFSVSRFRAGALTLRTLPSFSAGSIYLNLRSGELLQFS